MATAQVEHAVLLEGMGGYSSFITQTKEISPSGGIGAGVGAGYELSLSNFKIRTGVEFTNLRSAFRMDEHNHNANMIDTESEAYIGHFRFTDNRDRYNLGYVNVPLMLGFQFGKYYFLAGGKVGMNLFSNSRTLSTVTATATYPDLMEDLKDMPKHLYTTVDEKADYKPGFDINYSASFEAGAYLSNLGNGNFGCRVALFCDYGLKNVRENLPTENLVVNKSNANYYQPVMNDFLLSHDTKANLLFAGVKFAIIFKFDRPPICRCEEYISPKKGKR